MNDLKEICWATDIHLDHAHPLKIESFFSKINSREAENILISGDISNGKLISSHLELIANELNAKQIYFVLGNHDYYGSSFDKVHDSVRQCVKKYSNLHWLNESGFVKLSDKTALIGNSLWCDWKAGDWRASNVWLADYELIEDLKVYCMGAWGPVYYSGELRCKLHQIAADLTGQLKKDLEAAIAAGYKKIIAITHVPPFWKGSFHQGKVQDADWAVHFVCKTAGDMLESVMSKNPDCHLDVWSGHTHGYGEVDILSNLHAVNGAAVYKKPKPQKAYYYE